MDIIIAEKPSLARNIVNAIGNMKTCNGYYESEKYIVTFAFGHLFRLYDVDEYLGREKTKWDLDILPFVPEKFKFKLSENKGIKEQYELIKSLVLRSEVENIIHCGDTDREGQVIISNIINRIFEEENIKKPVKRLWVPEQTYQTISDGLNDLRDNEEYKNLFNEGTARTCLDWSYGINLTRYLSVKLGITFPVGRVLIPIVKFVYDRDQAIKNFIPETFFEIGATIKKDNIEIKTKLKDRRYGVNEKEKAEKLLISMQGKKAIVDTVEIKDVKKQPPKLFSLDTLQNKLFKDERMSLDTTLKNLQKLYEAGYTSYPRTNTEYVGEEEKDRVRSIISIIRNTFNVNLEFKDTKKIFNSSNIESHSAIIPTTKIPDEKNLTPGEIKVYTAIKNRFISNFLSEETIIEETNVLLKIDDEFIELKGNVIKQEGFLRYEKQNRNNELPKFTEGEKLNTVFTVDQKETQKPKTVTESELNNFLKNPYKKQEIEDMEEENDDDDYKLILQGCEIGTVGTRANIIVNAKEYDYLNDAKGRLTCSIKGIVLIETLEKLGISFDREKTVKFGKQLKMLYKNQLKVSELIENVKNELKAIVAKSNQINIEKIVIEKEVVGKCPLCGGDIVINKSGYGCSNWKEGCKFFINGKIAGKTMSEGIVKKLLKDKKTNLIRGFKNANGNPFDAFLTIDKGKVGFAFSKADESLGKCPVCGTGQIITNTWGFTCNRHEQGCKFFINNKIAGKSISEAIVKKLLQDNKSNLIKGFKSKNNKSFDAFLIIKDGKVSFKFQTK